MTPEVSNHAMKTIEELKESMKVWKVISGMFLFIIVILVASNM